MTPIRIQLRRTKGWKMPPNTVKVDRTTVWGNPFTVSLCGSREEAVRRYKAVQIRFGLHLPFNEIRGKNLACWCPLPKEGEPDLCHAAVLLELANR